MHASEFHRALGFRFSQPSLRPSTFVEFCSRAITHITHTLQYTVRTTVRTVLSALKNEQKKKTAHGEVLTSDFPRTTIATTIIIFSCVFNQAFSANKLFDSVRAGCPPDYSQVEVRGGIYNLQFTVYAAAAFSKRDKKTSVRSHLRFQVSLPAEYHNHTQNLPFLCNTYHRAVTMIILLQ